MNFETELDQHSSYRLLELDPELLEQIDSSDLLIKANGDDGHIHLCGPKTTYKLRQMNNSNTALIAKYPEDDENYENENGKPLLAFAFVPTILQAVPISEPVIPLTHTPYYMGAGEFMSRTSENFVQETLLDLYSRTPMSDYEFQNAWKKNCGLEYEGIACTVHPTIIQAVLSDILLFVSENNWNPVADKLDVQLMDCTRIKSDEPESVVDSVLQSFSHRDEASGTILFDCPSIVTFYGERVLETYANEHAIPIEIFRGLWSEAIPTIADWDLNFSLLHGKCVHGAGQTIRYLSPDILSPDPRARFKQLFSIKSDWELAELTPFLEAVWNKNLKFENFVMKFARKKKVGKKILISAR